MTTLPQAIVRLIDGQLVAEIARGPYRRTFGVDSLQALRSALLHDPSRELSDSQLMFEARREAALRARFAPRTYAPTPKPRVPTPSTAKFTGILYNL